MKTWNELTSEEKMLNISQLNDIFDFSHFEDAETAAYNVRNGYENDQDWFSFIVDDLDKFESEITELIESYFKRIEIDYDKERVYAYGYGCEGSPDNGDADIEAEMQDAVDADEPGKWEVQRAEYFEKEKCWSAKIIEQLDL